MQEREQRGAGGVEDETIEDIVSMPFETAKHLTTLDAGSIVLIGTFLKDIFPKDKNSSALAISDSAQFLVASSFVAFGVSLLTASFFLFLFFRAPRLAAYYGRDLREQVERTSLFFYLLSFLPFVLGQAFFGYAVLVEVVY